MINVSELKRNNLLFQKSRGITLQIDNPHGLHHITAWGVDWPIEDFEPITITPEWLERACFAEGFRDKLGKSWTIDIMPSANRVLGICYMTPRTLVSFVAEPGNIVMLRPIYYFHQLQNLYYDLTGEEITVKEIA